MKQFNFQKEELSPSLVEEMYPLLEEHNREVSAPEDSLDVDWGFYFEAKQGGILQIFTARVERVLVGYVVYVIFPHPHHKGVLTAFQDALFLLESYRKGLVGVRLITFSEEELWESGVARIVQSAKEKKDLSPLFKRLGYSVCDHIYEKRAR